jgi:hypothetical protein
MAINKFDVLALGRGQLADNTWAAIVFTSNNLVEFWDIGKSYNQYNVVEHSGRVYRSKVGSNIANSPDLSPNQWETLYVGPKDGDAAFVIDGAMSTLCQRANGIWAPINGQPLTVLLNDNQVVAADAVVFVGATKTFGKCEYTLKRGSGEGRKRKGTFNILNDSSTSLSYDHEFMDIGLDVNVSMYWDISGGNARLRYTSGNEGVAITLKYILNGWN